MVIAGSSPLSGGVMKLLFASQTACSALSLAHETFFKNTSRRWIFNEKDRLAERYVKFNPTELQRVAGEAIQDSCPNIVKLAEGGFNKVFLLRSNSGREVIARIPTPIAGPAHYTTASEVATMDFARTLLKLPVPKVLAYSSTRDNPVGAEYIIMDRVDGESLSSRWHSLTAEELKDVMLQVVEMEQKVFNHPFPGFGSLYHKKDLNDEPQIPVPVEDFCVGPIAGRQFWHGERSQICVDRGPWTSPVDCMTSAARREAAWIRQHAKAQPRQRFVLPTAHNIDPSEHTSLLSMFLQLAPCLIPPVSKLNFPILRHPDLSLGNILLDRNSTKIASIIDWQDTAILPLFVQAGHPAFCEHDFSKPQPMTLPTLPDNFNELSAEDQLQAKSQRRLELTNLYYTALTGLHNKANTEALKIPHFNMRQYLLQQTGYPWDADVINLRAALVGITSPEVWNSISTSPCTVNFTERERETAIEEAKEWIESEEMLSAVRARLCLDPEGGTDPENHEWASNVNTEFRTMMFQQAEEHERELA
ncbi:kinase-like domain-containing protein [Aspergillus californicus]